MTDGELKVVRDFTDAGIATPAEVVGPLLDRLEAVERERDGLAAHVERLFRIWDEMTEEAMPDVTLTDAMDAAFSGGPDVSSGRLKAQWQAEYAEELMKTLPDAVYQSATAGATGTGLYTESASASAWGDCAYNFLEEEAARLSHQAKEPTP